MNNRWKMKNVMSTHFFLVLVFVLGFQLMNAQTDVITTIKGEQIICTITKEDSAKVYFKLGGNLSSVEAALNRSEITAIKYAPKQKEPIPVLSVAPSQAAEYTDYVAPTLTLSSASETLAPIAPKRKSNAITLSLGLSAPVGKFKSTDLDTNEIGPANNGQGVGLNFVHRANNNFGIALSGFFARNELNSSPITEKFKRHTDSVWLADKAEWRAMGIQLGLFYLKEINDFSLYGKLSAGFLTLKYPDLKIAVSSSNYLQFEAASADALSLGASVGIGYTLLENLNVTMDATYVHAYCNYNEVLVLGEEPAVGFPKKISMTKRNVKQTYQTIFISLGMTYWF